jgi:ATP-dependent RNA helicase DDX10/DBP4
MPRKKPGNQNSKHHSGRQRKFDDDFAALQKRCLDEAPKRGHAVAINISSSTAAGSSSDALFATMPISSRTLEGLAKGNFTAMTAIQQAVLPHALAGRDVLGAAKTGSGKTLAFLIPVLERLLFQSPDGPAALIISPTRELSHQIFSVLTQIGNYHDQLTAGLLIGGRQDFYAEQEHIARTNIIVATPGRLLQHLEQTVDIDMSEVSIVVLDEADRCLDLGFRPQILRIFEYLPTQQPRQTLLFSATQSKDVASLGQLSLYRPEYIGVHDQAATVTPESLQQSYVMVPLQHKLNAIYSFVRTHLQCKSIVFFATCAQVRHAHALLCGLRPGIPVLALHGKLSQDKRSIVLEQFEKRHNDGATATNNQHAVLLCTDMCARGLDFAAIDWVVQVDAPESVDTYIHRVGRTARYRNTGKSLLFLTDREDEYGFIDVILGKSKTKIPIQRLGINPSQATTVTDRAASMAASNTVLHGLAKKAFQSYIRSIHFMPNHDVFRVESIDVDGYAISLGLPSTPNLQFLKRAAADREQRRDAKNVNKKLQRLKEQIKAEKLAKKLQSMPTATTAAVTTTTIAATSQSQKPIDADDDDSVDDDEVLVPKQRSTTVNNLADDDNEEEVVLPEVDSHQVTNGSKRQKTKIRADGGHGQNQKIVFDEDGNEQGEVSIFHETSNNDEPVDVQQLAEDSAAYMDVVRSRLERTRPQDEADHKDRIRQKHKKRRFDEKADRGEEDNQPGNEVVLGMPKAEGINDDDDQSMPRDNSSSSSSSSSSSDSSTSDDDDDSSVASGAADVRAQEDLALAMIRKASDQ